MKNHKYIVGLFCIITAFLISCKKGPFARVEISGRLVNYITGAPETGSFDLYNGAYGGSKGSVNYGIFYSNSDGSFVLRPHSWKGGPYRLMYYGKNDTGWEEKRVDLGKNHHINIGNLLTGSFDFHCKVTLNSVSGFSLTFTDVGVGAPHQVNAGTSTVFTATKTFSYEIYQILGNFYHISYRLNNSTSDVNIYVPLHPPSDTTSVTINY
jgi:hypothetical protein